MWSGRGGAPRQALHGGAPKRAVHALAFTGLLVDDGSAITRERLLGLHLHHDRRLLLATARRLLAAVLHRLMLRLASWCVILDLGILGYTVTQRPVGVGNRQSPRNNNLSPSLV
jgi:hypothetical protein